MALFVRTHMSHPLTQSNNKCTTANNTPVSTCTHTTASNPLPQRKREDDVELYPPCLEFAGRILAALKHVTVITSTGLGKTVDMDLGHNIMKTAVNYR